MGRQIILPTIMLILFVSTSVDLHGGETIHVDSQTAPSLVEAARRVNDRKETGSLKIVLAPGVYNLNRTVLFDPKVSFTEEERLILEAEILPDDPLWRPELMPVIISTEFPERWGEGGDPIEISGIKIETNHVTLRGLKFLGSPVPGIWYYPIFRGGKDLNDLLVTQCLFAMENYGVTADVGILANGHGVVVDHCVFYNCRNPVVFWRATGGKSCGCAMRSCIVEGAYTSGVWTCDTAEDFEFRRNIFSRCNYAWMRDAGNERTYRLEECVITECHHFSGICRSGFELAPAGKEICFEESKVVKNGKLLLEKSGGIDVAVSINFLHPMPGTLGCDLGAGLFIDSREAPYSHRTFTYKIIDGLEIQADVYLPMEAKYIPVVVYIHGGGLMFGSKESIWVSLRDAIVESNCALVSIDFRLAPETKVEEILQDVVDACKWIRSKGAVRYSLDPGRLALIGGSSGGYQVLLAGRALEPRPRAVISVSGLGDLDLLRKNHNPDRSGLNWDESPYSMVNKRPLTGSEDEERLKMSRYLMENGWLLYEILGFDPDEEPERYNTLSLFKDIPSDYPPTLVVHAEKDGAVPFREAERIMKALTERAIECELFAVEEGHASSLINKYSESVKRIKSFLNEKLK